MMVILNVQVFDHWVGFWLTEDKNQNTKAHINLFNDWYTQPPHFHFDITRYQKDKNPIKNNNGARLLSTTLVRKFLRLTQFCPPPKITYKINKTEWTQTNFNYSSFAQVCWLVLDAVLHYFNPDLLSVKNLASSILLAFVYAFKTYFAIV